MRKRIASFWQNYKFRFVPWIICNLNRNKLAQHNQQNETIQGEGATKGNQGKENLRTTIPSSVSSTTVNEANKAREKGTSEENDSISSPLIVHHVSKDKDNLISDEDLLDIMITLFESFRKFDATGKKALSAGEVSKINQQIMNDVLGYSIERRKSLVAEDAGTGVFLSSGKASPGSLIGLYPGSIYMPSEPLFFPSIGNPFIFRCSDGVHIDGNDKWLSKSIFKSCSARDKFRMDLPCCDDSWLGPYPKNPLNIGQYVNNRSKSAKNNVVYQEASVHLGGEGGVVEGSRNKREFPIHLCKYLPNVWANPGNNVCPLRLVPLVAVKEIREGDEILSSYFTVLHSK